LSNGFSLPLSEFVDGRFVRIPASTVQPKASAGIAAPNRSSLDPSESLTDHFRYFAFEEPVGGFIETIWLIPLQLRTCVSALAGADEVPTRVPATMAPASTRAMVDRENLMLPPRDEKRVGEQR
jgi:hypothetical protein